VLQGCNKGVTRVLQGLFYRVSSTFESYPPDGVRLLQGCYKGFTRVLDYVMRGPTIRNISRVSRIRRVRGYSF
jgi:hypothetical protein